MQESTLQNGKLFVRVQGVREKEVRYSSPSMGLILDQVCPHIGQKKNSTILNQPGIEFAQRCAAQVTSSRGDPLCQRWRIYCRVPLNGEKMLQRRSISDLSIRVAMVLGTFCIGIGAPSVGASDSKAILRLLDGMDSSYSRVNDYVAVFHNQERIDGKLDKGQTVLFKFQKPFKVYMKFDDGPSKGTEALYVEGSYENKLVVRQGGILGFMTFSLAPKGSLAMSRKRHPVTEVGFGFLLAEFRRNIEPAIRSGELDIMRLTDETFKGRPATVVEGRFLSHGGRKYYCARFIIHIDKELLLPVGDVFYDGKGEMFEDYVFTDVKLNVGLTGMDFSRDNTSYRF
jgi:hypothetical protein